MFGHDLVLSGSIAPIGVHSAVAFLRATGAITPHGLLTAYTDTAPVIHGTVGASHSMRWNVGAAHTVSSLGAELGQGDSVGATHDVRESLGAKGAVRDTVGASHD